jgi:acyl carrier protein
LQYFPMNSNGKIDKKALPLPSSQEINDTKSYKLPITDTEIRLLEIWKEVLAKEQISMDDNFFEIGGHSLLATQIATKIQANFNINLKLRSLFMNPSIEDLAAEIDAVNWLNINNQEEYKTENLSQFIL